MLRITLITLLITSVLIAVVPVIGYLSTWFENRALLSRHLDPTLRSTTIDLRPQVYAGLPAPVRRYFTFAFNGRHTVSVKKVRWQERGDFQLPVGQFRTRGKQVSHATDPNYSWTGLFFRFGVPLLESRDSFHIHGHDMRAKLLGWFKVMQTDYDEQEALRSLYSYLMLRYFGQAPLMPWALLPNDYVAWEADTEDSAYLTLTHGDLAGRYKVWFGQDGRIERMDIDRFLIEGNRVTQREQGLKLDYEEINGFMVPTTMAYTWYLEDGTVASRYRFDVSDITLMP